MGTGDSRHSRNMVTRQYFSGFSTKESLSIEHSKYSAWEDWSHSFQQPIAIALSLKYQYKCALRVFILICTFFTQNPQVIFWLQVYVLFSFCSFPAAKYVNKGARTLELNGVTADLGVEREREADAQNQWVRGGVGIVSTTKLVSGERKDTGWCEECGSFAKNSRTSTLTPVIFEQVTFRWVKILGTFTLLKIQRETGNFHFRKWCL